jgi:hypothetical protein
MLASLFVHVTDEPTGILIGFGLNPPLLMVAVTFIVLGEVGELFPHAVAAISKNTANESLKKDMISSLPEVR